MLRGAPGLVPLRTFKIFHVRTTAVRLASFRNPALILTNELNREAFLSTCFYVVPAGELRFIFLVSSKSNLIRSFVNLRRDSWLSARISVHLEEKAKSSHRHLHSSASCPLNCQYN